MAGFAFLQSTEFLLLNSGLVVSRAGYFLFGTLQLEIRWHHLQSGTSAGPVHPGQ